MNRSPIARALLPLAILPLVALAARGQAQDSIVLGKKLINDGRFTEALDVLEPAYMTRLLAPEPAKASSSKESSSKDFDFDELEADPSAGSPSSYLSSSTLVRLYRVTHQEARGREYLYRLYTTLRAKGDSRTRMVEDETIELALASGGYDQALDVLESQKKREKFAGFDLTAARIYAASGRREEALANLRSYLGYELSESPAQLLGYPEFASLHGDSAFAALLIHQIPLVDSRFQRIASLGSSKDTSAAALEEVLAAARVYAEVKDVESGRDLLEKLEEADKTVLPNLGRFRRELLGELRKEKNTYYRLTIGRMLAGLNDSMITREVAAELAGEDLMIYPKQFFYLAYTLARFDPQLARPFLKQMLRGAEESLCLSQHFMTLDWNALLMQAFGVAEPAVIDDLAEAVGSSDSAVSTNAIRILGIWQEPKLVDALMKRIDAATTPAERRRWIDMLSSIYLPETAEAMKVLQAKGGTPGEMLAVRVSLKALKPPGGELFADRDGVRITDPAMREIFFRTLEETHGRDVSYVEKTILLTATKADIPRLRRIRASILFRMSDEAIYDWQSIAKVIHRVRWEGGGEGKR